jgi:citrate lyase subunit beta / citryl-CoA lyase
MLAKSQRLGADEVVVDLEDSVAPEAKNEARATTVAALAAGTWQGPTVAVRVNPLATDWGARDVGELVASAGPALGSVVIPKVEDANDLHAVERLLGARPIALQALIETATGLTRVGEIAQASPRTETLIIGYADLAASLGRPAAAEYPGDRWHWVRETVLVAARAAGLQAIDGPHLDIADVDGLRVEARRARALGFDGKWAVHPSQVGPLNEVFSPHPEEIERAAAILAALENAEASGRGAVMLNGEMIDKASRKLALQVVARARAAGISTPSCGCSRPTASPSSGSRFRWTH